MGQAGWRKDTLTVANRWSVSHSTSTVYSQDQSTTQTLVQFHKTPGDCIIVDVFRDYSKLHMKHGQRVTGKFTKFGTNVENVANIFQNIAQILAWCHQHSPLRIKTNGTKLTEHPSQKVWKLTCKTVRCPGSSEVHCEFSTWRLHWQISLWPNRDLVSVDCPAVFQLIKQLTIYINHILISHHQSTPALSTRLGSNMVVLGSYTWTETTNCSRQ